MTMKKVKRADISLLSHSKTAVARSAPMRLLEPVGGRVLTTFVSTSGRFSRLGLTLGLCERVGTVVRTSRRPRNCSGAAATRQGNA